jgi:hypothetical protein
MAFAIRASRCDRHEENAAVRPESLDKLEMSNTLQLSSDKPELSGWSNTSVFQSFTARFADSTLTERIEETMGVSYLKSISHRELVTAIRIAALWRTSAQFYATRRKFGQN